MTKVSRGSASFGRRAARLLSLKSAASQLSYAPACTSRKQYQICCRHCCRFLPLSRAVKTLSEQHQNINFSNFTTQLSQYIAFSFLSCSSIMSIFWKCQEKTYVHRYFVSAATQSSTLSPALSHVTCQKVIPVLGCQSVN